MSKTAAFYCDKCGRKKIYATEDELIPVEFQTGESQGFPKQVFTTSIHLCRQHAAMMIIDYVTAKSYKEQKELLTRWTQPQQFIPSGTVIGIWQDGKIRPQGLTLHNVEFKEEQE